MLAYDRLGTGFPQYSRECRLTMMTVYQSQAGEETRLAL